MKQLIILAITLLIALPVFAADDIEDIKPPVISAPATEPPSDAIVLFDGTDLSKWEGGEWIVEDGAAIVNGGGMHTKDEFSDIQIHLEFAMPVPAEGEGQNRGNSGCYIQGMYEVQILDSYGNDTYSTGQCGAIYNQFTPMVNACRPPGEWQTYDIIFRAARFAEDGRILKKAVVTVFHNGVLIQDHVSVMPTPGGLYTWPRPTGPIYLQDHNHPVKYRNIWVRPLEMK